MGYADIRAALDRSFSVSLLNQIARLCHDLLGSDTSLRHPSAMYGLAVTAEKLAALLDGVTIQNDTVTAVEAHIKPMMEAVLNAADDDEERLVGALDNLARAYSEAASLLK